VSEDETPDDMHCAEFVELVTAYLDGALDPADERRFVEHLDLCDGCGRYLEQTRVTVDALGALPRTGLPPDARAALLRAFRERPREP
jgi:anti-sigma factor RsiW